MRELLAEDGSIYVHLDWHVGHYAKAVLDEVFGIDNFRSEIVWQKIRTVKAQSGSFGNVHDVIFFYSKTSKLNYKIQTTSQNVEYALKFDKIEPDSERRYQLVSLLQSGQGTARKFGDKVLEPPKGRHWIWSQERIDEALEKGLIEFTSGGDGTPRKKQYLDESGDKPVDDLWIDIFPLNSQSSERVNYPTQKPITLLERIIKASSNENDLILDCFCGSGTTAAAAEKLGRRWITCDLGRFAIHTARKRLLSISTVKPFVVQNLGKYERQAWQKDEFGANSAERIDAYNKFILELYNAEKLNGFAWLHGVRNGRVVHVGAVDSPVTVGDVKAIILEWKKNLAIAQSTGIDILGWEFALDINETAKQQAKEANVDARFVLIPREVLEKKAVEQGDIQFFELAALFTETRIKNRELQIDLTNFIAPLDYVPQDIREKIKDWKSWIDYWAVDFDFKGDTFHNQWQSYRTRKDRKIEVSCKHAYDAAGVYTIQVKVIDILGNDTTKTFQIEIKD